MSYIDKRFGLIFPTRSGAQIGAGNERAMLDRVGGATGYRKDYQIDADGSVTMLTTKNGNPQFSKLTNGMYGGTGTENSTYYMETGQLSWNFPAPESPDKYDPATWHFIDISTGDAYLGRANASGVQANTPALVEDQNSIAVGPPDASRTLEYGPTTVSKKMTEALFPASFFSGKMRLFIQATYGAAETLNSRIEIDSTSGGLMYRDFASESSLNFGILAQSSPGIFTASDGTYWLLNITEVWPDFVVTSYPFRMEGVLDLKNKIATLPDADKPKAEAYLFANSSIDLSKGVIVGTFPVPGGMPLAYGWKWNTSGSQAKIVMHEQIGTVVANYRWYSRTVTFDFDDGITMSGTIEDHGEWIDGWGNYNLFVPASGGQPDPLMLKSLRAGSGLIPVLFSFSNIPVYGWYVGDVWTPARITANEADGPPVTTNFSSVPPLMDGLTGWSTLDETKTVDNGRDFSFGGFTYQGSSSSISRYITTGTPGAITRAAYPSGGSGLIPYVPNYDGSTADNALNSVPYGCKTYPATIQVHWTMVSQTLSQQNLWALLIPGCDSEAMYLATYDVVTPLTQSNRTLDGDMGYIAFTAYTFHNDENGYPIWDVPIGDFPGRMMGIPETWYYFTHTDVTTSTPDATTIAAGVKCFNKKEIGTTGTPGGSYAGIFNCDYNYPYYDRGMYTVTSFGKRYVMSEGLKSPSSIVYGRSFVGWA